MTIPATLLRDFDLYGDGVPVARIRGNYQRLVHVPLNCSVRQLRLVPLATWGSETVRICDLELS